MADPWVNAFARTEVASIILRRDSCHFTPVGILYGFGRHHVVEAR